MLIIYFPTTSASSLFGLMYGCTLPLTWVLCSKAYARPMSFASVNFAPRKLIPNLEEKGSQKGIKFQDDKQRTEYLGLIRLNPRSFSRQGRRRDKNPGAQSQSVHPRWQLRQTQSLLAR